MSPPDGSAASTAAPRRGPHVQIFSEIGEMATFTVETLRSLPGALRYASEVLRQTGILVVGSTLFIAVMALFIGQTQTTFAYFVTQELGASDFLGAFSGIATPRISTAFTFGFAFAAKVGGGIVAEFGSMRVNEEIDAYEAEGVNPMRYLVGTRVLAALLYVPIAAGIAMLANGVGSWANSVLILEGVDSDSFWRFHWALQGPQELLFAVVTMSVMAVGIVFVSAYYGYHASGGPVGVGKAVSRALLINIPLGLIVAGLAQFAIYGPELRLPIGG